MALTAYQIQFRRRMKLVMRRRAAADRKVRAHVRLLALALTEAATAAGVMNRLNQLYNVDVSTQTLLVQAAATRVGEPVLTTMLGESQPGEEVVLFNQIPDGNGGQPLPNEAVFGESMALNQPVIDQAQTVVKPVLVLTETAKA